MNNDLISRSALKKALEVTQYNDIDDLTRTERLIDNFPTVDFEKLGESLRCQIRAEYGSCDDCELSCPRNELIKLLDSERPQGEPVIKCKDCKYQVKEWREDRRMKEKGYWTYGCKHFGELMGYWGFGGNDNEFCSGAEVKEAENEDSN